MPVSQKIGPDGCLYVLDWYDRYHCYQDANRDPQGIDRSKGRIYRIRYGDPPHVPPFDLQKMSHDELIKLLRNPNVWWRRQAQRRAEREVRRVDGSAASEDGAGHVATRRRPTCTRCGCW